MNTLHHKHHAFTGLHIHTPKKLLEAIVTFPYTAHQAIHVMPPFKVEPFSTTKPCHTLFPTSNKPQLNKFKKTTVGSLPCKVQETSLLQKCPLYSEMSRNDPKLYLVDIMYTTQDIQVVDRSDI
jgi:hypothetical protein